MYLQDIRKLIGKRIIIVLLIVPVLLLLFLNKEPLASNYSNKNDGVFIIENRHMLLRYDPELNSFEICNKRNGRVYRTEPSYGFITSEVVVNRGIKMEILFKTNDEYGGFSAVSEIELSGGSIKGTIKAEQHAPLKKPLAFPGAFSGEEEKQYLVVPYAEGLYIPANRKFELGSLEMWSHKSTMPFTGMTDSETGIMVTSASPCDTAIEFVRPATGYTGNYLMQLVHYPVKGSFGYDRTFYIDLVQKDGYNEMADIFRNYLDNRQASAGPLEDKVPVTLKEKLKANRNVDKLVGAVDFWLGPMDMKDTVIIDDLTLNGVKKALINFQYGWKVFDNEKRPLVIQYAAEKGFLPGRYDCYSDIFDTNSQYISPRIRTEGFQERVIIRKDGGFQEGYKNYYNNQPVQGYRMNTEFSVQDVDAYLEADLKENNYLSRFVDVIASCMLYEDYSKCHPMTRSQDLKYRYDLLNKISSRYGMITGTEEMAWWTVPVSHYSEGTMTIVPPTGAGDAWSTPIENPGELYEKYTVNPAVRIPLKSLVYHDCHVSGWYTGDGVSKIMDYWRTKDLLTALYGAMNLVFPCDRDFWEQYKHKYLWSIKVTGWVFEKTGYEKMERHDFLTADGLVQKTEFSNGVKIIANFSDKAYKYGNRSIPADNFILIDRKSAYTSDQIYRQVLYE